MPLAQLPSKHESMEINLHFSLSYIKFTLDIKLCPCFCFWFFFLGGVS